LSPSTILDCVVMVNENYVDGTSDKGDLVCTSSSSRRRLKTKGSENPPPGLTYTEVDWFKSLSCDLDWDGAACYLERNFIRAFPNGLLLGDKRGEYLLLHSVSDVRRVKNSGQVSQVVALALNVEFDRCSREGTCNSFCENCHDTKTGLGFAELRNGHCNGMAVRDLLQRANCVLGHTCRSLRVSGIMDCVNKVNSNFRRGVRDSHNLDSRPAVASTPPPSPLPLSMTRAARLKRLEDKESKGAGHVLHCGHRPSRHRQKSIDDYKEKLYAYESCRCSLLFNEVQGEVFSSLEQTCELCKLTSGEYLGQTLDVLEDVDRVTMADKHIQRNYSPLEKICSCCKLHVGLLDKY